MPRLPPEHWSKEEGRVETLLWSVEPKGGGAFTTSEPEIITARLEVQGAKGRVLDGDVKLLDSSTVVDIVASAKFKKFPVGSVVLASLQVYPSRITVQRVELLEKKEEEVKEMSDSKVLEGYYISPEARLVFSTVHRMSGANPKRAVKLMMVGPSGFGKSTIPELFSQVTGREYYYMNCASIRDPEEWFGYREAREGSTLFIRSEFIKRLEKGNAVIILDEFNRLEPWLHNALYPLLDHRGRTVVHDEEFAIGPGIIIVGTINTGYRFTGTFELDEALYNRFDAVLEVGPLPVTEEVSVLVKRTGIDSKVASSLVKIANILRQSEVSCSTRTTLNVAQMYVAGMDLRQAFENAVIKRIPIDSAGNNHRKSAIDAVNSHIGVFSVSKSVSGDVFKGAFGEVAKVEEVQDETKVPAFIFRKKEGESFSLLGFQKILRSLPVSISISTGEAADLAVAVEGGREVLVPLSREFTSEDPIIAELRKVGVTGRYHKTLNQVRGPITVEVESS